MLLKQLQLHVWMCSVWMSRALQLMRQTWMSLLMQMAAQQQQWQCSQPSLRLLCLLLQEWAEVPVCCSPCSGC